MMPHFVTKYTLLIAGLLLGCTAASPAVPITPGRYPVPDTDCRLPYMTSRPLMSADPNVRFAVLAVHSSSHDAVYYYTTVDRILDEFDLHDKYIIVAPQFLRTEHVKDITEPGLLYWKVNPFWGSSLSRTPDDDKDRRISAYDVLDALIADLCRPGRFENLERITVLGHSAGGQLVNRYAAANPAQDRCARPRDIDVRYIVLNPSSYVYFGPKRSVGYSVSEFAVPSADVLAANGAYNHYGYGTEKLYAYHRGHNIDANLMKLRYINRDVVYLLGEEDCKPDSSMSTHPSAMLQGRNRLERGRIYYGHLIDTFGVEAVRENHRLIVVPGVGHSSRGCLNSAPGKAALLK